ncbi:nucleotidyltransferase substrate binding protein [Marinobacterium sp. D7]|uniref:HI0074 family nucleotidyltransferase substrate-binding subunit n=1 Tax=Marinobacterium ramblicola TaxID=2849041 RepID=UPI001C2D55C7|nr:HI0074 family nucleotidyltransferase substrate-binding subunit [Marinobacterium ramblicola]MBV1788442.1 nucleotidyltransferase substrate binding protein [Marinobacterium ramblicola]
MQEKLDLSVLARAIATLKVALDEYQKDPSNEFVRDSCIQRFEYSYDLSTKMIRRYLSLVAANPGEVQEMSFQSLIREAYTLGIVENSWDQWWEYRDNRNKTSHGYNRDTAIEIVEGLPRFYQEADFLLQALTEKNEDQV